MPDPTTANIQLFQPTRGSDVGTWDVPVNGNMGILDLILGGVAVIPLNNANVTLASSQYESKTITFNSTLTGSVIITFPTSFIKSYEIYNVCSGSSSFTVTLATTGGGQVVCAPPGETVEVWNDGSNIRYKNMDRVGTYWDYAGSSVPAWVSGCTVPPYLNCDGTTFSSGTYPQLTTILGSTTLPDSKGRARFTLDQGSSRLTIHRRRSRRHHQLCWRRGQTVTHWHFKLPHLQYQLRVKCYFLDWQYYHTRSDANPGAGFVFPDANFMSRRH